MNRRGVALLAVLWFVVLASGVALAILARGRTDLLASINRVDLIRGRWAAEACLAIVVDEHQQGRGVPGVERVDLGGRRWCRAEVEDPGAALRVDRMDARQLALLFGNDSVAAAILDWIDQDDVPRPLGAERPTYQQLGRGLPRNAPVAGVDELLDVLGVDSVRLALASPFLTTRGSGAVDLNSAPAAVLALLPGMSAPYAEEVVARRRRGGRIESLDDLVMGAPPTVRVALVDAYAELHRWVVVAPEVYVVHAIGAEGAGARAEVIATYVPAGDRLALVRKEVW